MSVMYIGHMSVFVFGVWMFMFVGMSFIVPLVNVKFIVTVPMLVHNRHMNMKVGMFFICQQVGTSHHQDGGQDRFPGRSYHRRHLVGI